MEKECNNVDGCVQQKGTGKVTKIIRNIVNIHLKRGNELQHLYISINFNPIIIIIYTFFVSIFNSEYLECISLVYYIIIDYNIYTLHVTLTEVSFESVVFVFAFHTCLFAEKCTEGKKRFTLLYIYFRCTSENT